MIPRKFLLLILLPLLIPIGIAMAQSSTNYGIEGFVTMGGGSAASANYSVTSVIGQPATDVVNSATYKVSGGLLHPHQPGSASPGNHRMWLPMILK